MSSARRKPEKKITHALEDVNAELAGQWLVHNLKNRSLRQTIVERYRNDMIAGRWATTGDPIRFDVNGNLIDGQHRLSALSELPDIALPMMVIRGLPVESQGAMDQGVKRTPGDQLQLIGVRDPNAVAAAVKKFIVWESGLLFRDNKHVTSQVTAPRIEEWVTTHADEVEFLGSIISLTKQNDAPPSVAASAAIGFGRVDRDGCAKFFTLLARGAGGEGHPITTLDKRLQRMRREGLKMSDRDYLSLFILAWNAWRNDKRMVKFQRPRGGSWTDETFPKVA